jgi:hypothetical protein
MFSFETGAAMPYFKGDFTTLQLQLMRDAAAETAKALSVQGDADKERDIALAILKAATAGEWTKGDLVKAAMAEVGGSCAPREQQVDETRIRPGSASR